MNNYVEEIIDYYLGNKTIEGALYIDGSWGSGKTFFIKHHFEGDKKYIYISLNGLTDISQINSQIMAFVHPKLESVKNNHFVRLLFSGSKALLSASTGIETDGISNVLNDFVNNISPDKVDAIIFDDLERTRIDIQELFGYIANLLDTKIKVIIIGFDKEVRRYLQSHQNNIDKLISSSISNNFEDYRNNLSEVKEPLIYDSIKEKIIYKEVHFVLNKNILFKEIANSYPTSIKKLLKNNKGYIEKLMDFYNCSNLRICKNAIEIYTLFIKKLRKKFVNDYEMKNMIFISIFMYAMMNGTGKNELYNGEDVYLENKLICSEYIENYVCSSTWNKGMLLKELEKIDETLSYQNDAYPDEIKRLSGYWLEKDEDDIIKNIKTLYNNILDLDVVYYKKGLYLLFMYNEWFETNQYDLNVLLEKMKEKIKTYNGILIFDSAFYIDNSVFHEEYGRVLDDAVEKHNFDYSAERIKKDIIEYRDVSKDRLEDISKIALNNNCFLSMIDIEDLIENIDKKDNIYVTSIRNIISGVYNFNNLDAFFKNDAKAILDLKNGLTRIKTTSKLKKKAIELLIADLDEYCKQILK